MKSNSGFTLIEVLIAMAVTLIIMGGAYTVFNSQQKTTLIQNNVSDVQQKLRASMDFVARDIRMAGYDPTISLQFGIRDIRFRDVNDNLSAAGNSYIQFSWDKNSNGTLDNDETMEYSLVNGVTITPGVNDLYLRTPNNPPPPPAPPRSVIGSNITTLGLAYAIDTNADGILEQDAAGNIGWFVDTGNNNIWDTLNVTTGATAATATVINTANIRAVRIWMLAQAEAPDLQFTDNNTYIVGPHVIVPNNNFRHRLFERTILCRNMGLNL